MPRTTASRGTACRARSVTRSPEMASARRRLSTATSRCAPRRPDGVREIFGPFAVDTGRQTIMRSATGFEQVKAPHVRQSELCASCHTLITEAFGPDGNVIGSLPEQMNFQEWRHSAFYKEGRSCQSCHMPRADGPIRVSSVLGAERDGLSRHAFVGGNAFMLRLMNRFRTVLGIEAPAAQMEATARLTEKPAAGRDGQHRGVAADFQRCFGQFRRHCAQLLATSFRPGTRPDGRGST